MEGGPERETGTDDVLDNSVEKKAEFLNPRDVIIDEEKGTVGVKLHRLGEETKFEEMAVDSLTELINKKKLEFLGPQLRNLPYEIEQRTTRVNLRQAMLDGLQSANLKPEEFDTNALKVDKTRLESSQHSYSKKDGEWKDWEDVISRLRKMKKTK